MFPHVFRLYKPLFLAEALRYPASVTHPLKEYQETGTFATAKCITRPHAAQTAFIFIAPSSSSSKLPQKKHCCDCFSSSRRAPIQPMKFTCHKGPAVTVQLRHKAEGCAHARACAWAATRVTARLSLSLPRRPHDIVLSAAQQHGG